MPDPTATRFPVPLELPVRRRLVDAGLAVHSASTTRTTVDLYDTGDRRLAAAGAELSLHRRHGWRWNRDPVGNPKLAPREWTAPLSATTDLVASWSRAYRRGRPLARRATVCIHRRGHEVSGAPLGRPMTLTEERVDEGVAGAWTPRLRRIVIPDSADGADATVVRELLHGASSPAVQTLAALRPALVRAPRLQPPDAAAHAPRELLVRSLMLSVMQWLYFDSELAGPGSPDALRKLRVALRRLRSDLQTFAVLVDREWAAALRERLGDLAGRLGTVRDAEVLLDRLTQLTAMLPEADRDSAAPLVDTAGMQLATARAELLHEISLDPYIDLLDAAITAVTQPHWSDRAHEVTSVTQLVAKRWQRLRRFVSTLDAAPADEDLHRVRLLAKRVRYAADASVPAVGEPAAASAGAIAVVQTVLGEHHDAAVTRAWLRRQALASADVAFVAGQFAALELHRLRDAGERWPAAWDSASRRKDWRWLRS